MLLHCKAFFGEDEAEKMQACDRELNPRSGIYGGLLDWLFMSAWRVLLTCMWAQQTERSTPHRVRTCLQEVLRLVQRTADVTEVLAEGFVRGSDRPTGPT